MQHLFQSWDSFSSSIRAASHILFLSDYDGTLTPIAGRPEEAFLSSGVKEKLRALAERPAVSTGIISGRRLSDVEALVGIEGIYYAGNHGLEIGGPGFTFVNEAAKATQGEMKSLAEQFCSGLAGIQGIIVEDKGLSLSIHYRLVRESEVEAASEILGQITAPGLRARKIKVTSGKKVWEVRPPMSRYEGKAVMTLRKEIRSAFRPRQLVTIYLGDDETDEDAFRVTHRPQSWSIFIGPENASSSAEYSLNSPSEVEVFLSRLLEMEEGVASRG